MRTPDEDLQGRICIDCCLPAMPEALRCASCTGKRERWIKVGPELLEALREIAKGEGRYNRDPLVHADHCIEDMKALANAAIAKAEGGGE